MTRTYAAPVKQKTVAPQPPRFAAVPRARMMGRLPEPTAVQQTVDEERMAGDEDVGVERVPRIGHQFGKLRVPSASAPGMGMIQPKSSAGGLSSSGIHEAARLGISGTGGRLPFLGRIQRSFGRHDVSGVVAHTDRAAATGSAAMGAAAFTMGNHVAFAGTPDLHTTAHEAAHTVQQRESVQLLGGVGQVGDRYERHADAVADRVVRGESSEGVLDGYAQPARARVSDTIGGPMGSLLDGFARATGHSQEPGSSGNAPKAQAVQRKWRGDSLPSEEKDEEPERATMRTQYEQVRDEWKETGLPFEIYWNDAEEKIFVCLDPDSADPSCTEYCYSKRRWTDDAVQDHNQLTDIRDEAHGLFASAPLTTRLGQALLDLDLDIDPVHIATLLKRENIAEIDWLVALSDRESVSILVIYLNRCEEVTLAMVRLIFTFNEQFHKYPSTSIAHWIGDYGYNKTMAALQTTNAVNYEKLVDTWLQCGGDSNDSPAYQQLIHIKANLKDNHDSMRVSRADGRYLNGNRELSRTGFLIFTCLDNTTVKIHTHWDSDKHEIYSMHVQVAGENSLEINKWRAFFSDVETAVCKAHNDAVGILAPTGGNLSLQK